MRLLKIVSFSLLLVLAVLTNSINSQTNSWNGITPLKSTREEVEKLLGKPMPHSKAKDAASYKTKSERVFVLYSTGYCNIKPSNGWNIPKGKVIRITVEPDVKPKFAEFKFDESKYRKSQDSDYVDVTSYINEADGIGFEVNTGRGVIDHFRYFPELKDDHLICPK